jgi:hypothetical protein
MGAADRAHHITPRRVQVGVAHDPQHVVERHFLALGLQGFSLKPAPLDVALFGVPFLRPAFGGRGWPFTNCARQIFRYPVSAPSLPSSQPVGVEVAHRRFHCRIRCVDRRYR